MRIVHSVTEGRRNSDFTTCDNRVYNTPLSQDVLRSRSVGGNSSNVKAYVVPGQKYDILSVKGLNKCWYAVFHHPDPEELGAYAVINKKTA